MTKTPKHTLVLHINPDLEACFMAHLFLAHEDVRASHGVVDSPQLKFIPGGPLREEDWPGVTERTAAALEEAGYVFLDCGGGAFDQHGRPENLMRNSVSSLDLMVLALGLDERLPHLMPIAKLISDNDLTGQDVASAHSPKKTSTPHTPRHLRNAILGWNALHKGDPAKVVRIASTAFGCIERCIDRAVADGREAELVYKDLFLCATLLTGSVAHFKTVFGLDAEDEAMVATEAFGDQVEAGLVALEEEWKAAVRDYWAGAKLRTVQVAKRTPEGVAYETVTIAYGRSASSRFGAVTRFGNAGQVQGRPRRNKADVTIQFSDGGKFVISTKGITLERVAQAIREADLKRRGVALTAADVRTLDKSGHLKFADRNGRDLMALYLAEYRTAFGNAFRANPFADRTPLKEQEIVDLTVKALSSL